jgi:dolichyl-phosphate beta-glucosyltransferase
LGKLKRADFREDLNVLFTQSSLYSRLFGTLSGIGGRPVKLSLIIPAHNEETRLPRTLQLICEALPLLATAWEAVEVITVCDGCTDNTAGIAKGFAMPGCQPRVISYTPNRGKGYALRVGFAASQGDVVGFLDADSASSMPDVCRLAALAGQEGNDVVIGSRRSKDARLPQLQPVPRRLAGQMFAFLVKTLFNLPVKDTQCGLKFLKGPLARALFDDCCEDGFAIDIELLLRAQRRGCIIREIGIEWRHQGRSTVSLVRHGWQMLKALRRLSHSRPAFSKKVRP